MGIKSELQFFDQSGGEIGHEEPAGRTEIARIVAEDIFTLARRDGRTAVDQAADDGHPFIVVVLRDRIG